MQAEDSRHTSYRKPSIPRLSWTPDPTFGCWLHVGCAASCGGRSSRPERAHTAQVVPKQAAPSRSAFHDSFACRDSYTTRRISRRWLSEMLPRELMALLQLFLSRRSGHGHRLTGRFLDRIRDRRHFPSRPGASDTAATARRKTVRTRWCRKPVSLKVAETRPAFQRRNKATCQKSACLKSCDSSSRCNRYALQKHPFFEYVATKHPSPKLRPSMQIFPPAHACLSTPRKPETK